MNTTVRTTHSTQSLLKISKMVAVLLLIFLPLSAQANIFQQSSSNQYGNSSIGEQTISQPSSYQMTNTSSYQVGTTYNPAQTIYEPFSNEAPGSNGPSKISNRKNNYGDGWVDSGEHGKEESPIGDAWSLLIFAAIGAGVIYYKRRKKLEAKEEVRG